MLLTYSFEAGPCLPSWVGGFKMLPGVFAIRAQFCPHPMQRLAGCHTNQGLACCLYFNKYSIKRQIMFFSSEQGFVVTNDYPSICLGSTEKPRVKKRNGTNQRNVLERRLREQESPVYINVCTESQRKIDFRLGIMHKNCGKPPTENIEVRSIVTVTMKMM
ncbi:uncharacterized protein LOC144333374 isoform X1 [Macaca mulatta]